MQSEKCREHGRERRTGVAPVLFFKMETGTTPVLLVCLLAAALTISTAHATNSFPVTIRVDASKPIGPLRPIWRFFGGDEPNYATMKDGQKLMADYGKLRPKDVYFRTHNLLNTGDGTPALKWGSTDAYQEDPQGQPIYNWT